MRTPLTLAITVALSAPVALAQQAATLTDVTVQGTTDLLANFLKASLSVQPGAALSSVNLRQVEQDALATGYVKTASAKLSSANGQNVLTLTVVANPVIKSVAVTGMTFLPADDFKTSLGNVLNIAPGATLNTARIDQSKQALAENYRAQGYPFAPNISTQTKAAADGTVDLTYVIDETAPIKRIEVSGSTLLPKDTVVSAFKPLYDAKKFTPEVYFAGVQQIQDAYQAAGYLASGVNPAGNSLQDGVLKISVVEGQVAGVDLSNLGLSATDAATLRTKAGGVPSLSVLEQDVRALSNRTGKSVGFALQAADPTVPNRVTVLFGVADAVSGPVKEIRFAGNTAIPTAQLQAAVKTKVGDIFSRQLAESDFIAVRDLYRKAGNDISTRDAVSFKDGVLTYTIHEARVAGYEIQWTGKKNTQERVLTRELPAAGGLYNEKAFRSALDRITALGVVRVTGVTTKAADPKTPENLTYVISVSEVSGSRSIPVGLQYDSLSGFSGTLEYQNNNLFGLGHTLNAGVTAGANDAGQSLSGNLAYTIPWLDIDFLDFRTNRTRLTLNAGSNASGNNALTYTTAGTSDTTQGVPQAHAAGQDTLRDYTVRTTGFGVNVGRNLTTSLSASVGVNTQYSTYYLEKQTAGEKTADTDAVAANAANPTATPKPIAASDDVAKALLPKNNLTTVVGTGLSYDTTVTPDFPTGGVRASVSAGYGFGRSGTDPLSWTKLEGGASTYYGLGKTLTKGFGTEQKQQAFAVRVNTGTLIGTPPPGTKFSVGYSNVNPAYELRGYDAGAFSGTNYITSSAEYRYDFNVSNSIAQGLYGIAFVDAGTAWNAGDAITLHYAVGLGAQLNLGFNNTPLAQVRFDYGFSPQTGSSKFHFRLGPVW
ncbi:BamA/OMP85 family outer membrane protein [Deinococcus sonorensis]|uniref:POTRA domain-containing protein n=2 Tax=Deinococcus sonorensis TaxID=309891 RepID=A0AAU7U9M9_9DEIO